MNSSGSDDTHERRSKEDATQLPTFGSSLDHFRAGPAKGRVTRSQSSTPVKKSRIEEEDPVIARSSSASPVSKKRKRRDEAQYTDLCEIPDRLADDLDILFCGYNPGVRSAELGFHYAHPSNRFYRILHASGLTPYKLDPSESPRMPELYRLGLTDLVARCTAKASEVSGLEFQAGATGLLAKLVKWNPKVLCFVGMDVYRNFRKHFPHAVKLATSPRKGAAPKEDPLCALAGTSGTSIRKQSTSDVQLGLQQMVISVPGDASRHFVRLWVIPSTSGLAAGLQDADRVGYLRDAQKLVASIKEGKYRDPENTLIIQAEDHLQARVGRLENGKWGMLVGSDVPFVVVKKEEEETDL